MSAAPEPREAIRIVEVQLGELLGIANTAKSSRDARLGFEKLNRWKARTVRLLSENIHPNEGQKLKGKPTYSFMTYGIALENLLDAVSIYSGFLESLLDELQRHPEDVLNAPTPSDEEVKTVKATQPASSLEQETSLSATSGKANWEAIEGEFGITKRGFGIRINFIRDPLKRTLVFRDTEQAFVLASSGFSKPAVILAGGVIEELLRLYLRHKHIKPIKDDFEGYIQTCQQQKLLEEGISRLSDSARHFRNLVHISKEKTKRHTISKSTAKGAVSSIFTIANDF